MNGATETMMSRIGVCGDAPLATNSSRPKGGVARLISSTISINTPNHTGSNPTDCTIGMNSGMVIIIMLTWSMKQPRNSRISSMPTSSMTGVRPAPRIAADSPAEACENAMICEKVIEPQMMNSVMTVKRKVCRTDTAKLFQVSRR
jgi:hypothetical protein